MADGSRAIESRAIDDELRLFEAMEDAWFAEGANLDYTRFVDTAEERTKDNYVTRIFQQVYNNMMAGIEEAMRETESPTASQTILKPIERNWFLTYNQRTARYANE